MYVCICMCMCVKKKQLCAEILNSYESLGLTAKVITSTEYKLFSVKNPTILTDGHLISGLMKKGVVAASKFSKEICTYIHI